MMRDSVILRKLAWEYMEIAHDPQNARNIELHKAVNDLKQIRPTVLIDELPWSELNVNNALTLQCQDPFLREIEQMMRRKIFQHRYFPADMVVRPYIPIQKIVNSTGIGITVDEAILKTDDIQNHIVAHEYQDQFADDSDLDKLHNAIISYDEENTRRHYNLLGELIGDIIPVKIVGFDYFSVTTWDEISTYRGVTPLLMDLIERPTFMHALVSKLTNIKLDELRQFEELGLFENDPDSLHCTPIVTDDLPKATSDDCKLTRKNIWGRGAAQIFASVSNDMHEEFDIAYMKKTIGTCGLAYYGCCEPLDKKMDIVEKIPNLRKVSITPWADVNVAAEAINKKYVLESKPNPASVAVGKLDIPHLRKEITTILDACEKNGCSCDIVLKDISTCGHRPENIFEWEKEVMSLVKSR